MPTPQEIEQMTHWPRTRSVLPQGGLLAEDQFDLGLTPLQAAQNPPTLLELKRRKLELLQALADKLTGGNPVVPRNDGGLSYSPGQSTLRAGSQRFIGNMLGVPNLAANATAVRVNDLGLGVPKWLAEKAGMDYPTMQDAFGGRNTLGLPSASDAMTAIDATGEAAGAVANLDASQFSPDQGEASRFRTEVMAQQNPGATAVGGLLGDVATLAGLRAPVSRMRAGQVANAAERQALLRAEQIKAQEAGLITNPLMAKDIPAMVQRMTSRSRGFGSLMEKTGRVAETGLEGAVLGILTEKDPLETAAWAAGTQAAGNLTLGLMPGGSLAKIGLAAVAATTLFQTANSVLPGGQDRILPAVEAGFNKVALGLTAGLLMGMAGMGRVPSNAMPMITDYMTALPRAATISVINDMQSDPTTLRVVQKLSVDPNYFGPAAARRLERAFRNPNISISGVIDDLMEQRAFREKYEALERTD